MFSQAQSEEGSAPAGQHVDTLPLLAARSSIVPDLGGADGMAMLAPAQRWYQVWQGNNTFLCRGRVMLGSQPCMLFVTTFLCVVPSALFSVFIAPQLVAHHAALALVLVLTATSLATLAATAVTDPGVIPRNPGPRPSPPPQHADSLLQWRYCGTCNINRPPRAKHCHYCDNCVLRYDHHCPWVGTCIGERNYAPFFAFLLVASLHSGFISLAALLQLLQVGVRHDLDAVGGAPAPDTSASTGATTSLPTHPLISSVASSPLSVILLVLSVPAFLFSFSLLCFHSYLVRTNKTTNEVLRSAYQGRAANPFDEGCARNCGLLYLRPRHSMLPPMRSLVPAAVRRLRGHAPVDSYTFSPQFAEDIGSPGRALRPPESPDWHQHQHQQQQQQQQQQHNQHQQQQHNQHQQQHGPSMCSPDASEGDAMEAGRPSVGMARTATLDTDFTAECSLSRSNTLSSQDAPPRPSTVSRDSRAFTPDVPVVYGTGWSYPYPPPPANGIPAASVAGSVSPWAMAELNRLQEQRELQRLRPGQHQRAQTLTALWGPDGLCLGGTGRRARGAPRVGGPPPGATPANWRTVSAYVTLRSPARAHAASAAVHPVPDASAALGTWGGGRPARMARQRSEPHLHRLPERPLPRHVGSFDSTDSFPPARYITLPDSHTPDPGTSVTAAAASGVALSFAAAPAAPSAQLLRSTAVLQGGPAWHAMLHGSASESEEEEGAGEGVGSARRAPSSTRDARARWPPSAMRTAAARLATPGTAVMQGASLMRPHGPPPSAMPTRTHSAPVGAVLPWAGASTAPATALAFPFAPPTAHLGPVAVVPAGGTHASDYSAGSARSVPLIVAEEDACAGLHTPPRVQRMGLTDSVTCTSQPPASATPDAPSAAMTAAGCTPSTPPAAARRM